MRDKLFRQACEAGFTFGKIIVKDTPNFTLLVYHPPTGRAVYFESISDPPGMGLWRVEARLPNGKWVVVDPVHSGLNWKYLLEWVRKHRFDELWTELRLGRLV
jgi:hypothetical protein